MSLERIFKQSSNTKINPNNLDLNIQNIDFHSYNENLINSNLSLSEYENLSFSDGASMNSKKNLHLPPSLGAIDNVFCEVVLPTVNSTSVHGDLPGLSAIKEFVLYSGSEILKYDKKTLKKVLFQQNYSTEDRARLIELLGGPGATGDGSDITCYIPIIMPGSNGALNPEKKASPFPLQKLDSNGLRVEIVFESAANIYSTPSTITSFKSTPELIFRRHVYENEVFPNVYPFFDVEYMEQQIALNTSSYSNDMNISQIVNSGSIVSLLIDLSTDANQDTNKEYFKPTEASKIKLKIDSHDYFESKTALEHRLKYHSSFYHPNYTQDSTTYYEQGISLNTYPLMPLNGGHHGNLNLKLHNNHVNLNYQASSDTYYVHVTALKLAYFKFENGKLRKILHD